MSAYTSKYNTNFNNTAIDYNNYSKNEYQAGGHNWTYTPKKNINGSITPQNTNSHKKMMSIDQTPRNLSPSKRAYYLCDMCINNDLIQAKIDKKAMEKNRNAQDKYVTDYKIEEHRKNDHFKNFNKNFENKKHLEDLRMAMEIKKQNKEMDKMDDKKWANSNRYSHEEEIRRVQAEMKKQFNEHLKQQINEKNRKKEVEKMENHKGGTGLNISNGMYNSHLPERSEYLYSLKHQLESKKDFLQRKKDEEKDVEKMMQEHRKQLDYEERNKKLEIELMQKNNYANALKQAIYEKERTKQFEKQKERDEEGEKLRSKDMMERNEMLQKHYEKKEKGQHLNNCLLTQMQQKEVGKTVEKQKERKETVKKSGFKHAHDEFCTCDRCKKKFPVTRLTKMLE